MSYKVLYRKYRPNNFDEIVGQKAVVRILQNSIVNNKISHAYLFAGPRGTGKTSMARIFAKTINCENNKNGLACGKCQNCLNFNESPDIIEIDAASNNGVNEIRELINNVKIMPSESKYKVYIIDEVHMLSTSAFNALLLTLEEPPSHVIFILATTNIENVPITIISRCQKYEFYRISNELITEHLQKICDQEKIEYDIDGLKEITELADGGLRDALSMLDQLSKENKKITLDLVIKELGSISLLKIKDLIEALDANDIDKVDLIIDDFQKTNLNYKIVIKKIVEILSQKAIIVLKDGSKTNLNYSNIKNIIFELNDCLNKININVNPYIIIKMILLNCCKGENNFKEKVNNNEIVTKLEKNNINTKEINKEEKDDLNKSNNIKENNDELNKLKQIRINNCFVNVNKECLLNIKSKWEEFLNGSSKLVKGLLTDSMPVAASEDYLILTSGIVHQSDEINRERSNIEQELNNFLQKKLKLIALSNEEWAMEKEKYISNLKQGKTYEFIEEEKTKKEDTTINLEKLAKNLFDESKIEIK